MIALLILPVLWLIWRFGYKLWRDSHGVNADKTTTGAHLYWVDAPRYPRTPKFPRTKTKRGYF